MYDKREVVEGEIAAQGNDRFNAAVPKMFHLQVEKGGSELIDKYVKKKLNLPHLPDPLVYGPILMKRK